MASRLAHIRKAFSSAPCAWLRGIASRGFWGLLGNFYGLTSYFTPAVRAQLLGIVIGSTVKGIIAGVLIGWFARKVNSLAAGIAFGLAVGLLLAFAVAAIQPGPDT